MSFPVLERAWYRQGSWSWILLPFSWLFMGVSELRKRRLLASPRPTIPVPVVVVGNIAVGGTGKTPLLMAIVDYFLEQGFRPGVVSRGYGGRSESYPCAVTESSNSEEVGDEPLLYVSKCPVVVDPDRDRAVRYLLQQYNCDVVFSDDGLQHYRLQRDIEIVVVDGQRGFGNGRCLPAGPLRELPRRLLDVDYVIVNTPSDGFQLTHAGRYDMTVAPVRFRNLGSEQSVVPAHWAGDKKVHAIAGIGHPQRFATTLEQLGFEVELHSYPDHYCFRGDEFQFSDQRPVMVTAKDAVKIGGIDLGAAADNVWSLDITACVDTKFFGELADKIAVIKRQKNPLNASNNMALDQVNAKD